MYPAFVAAITLGALVFLMIMVVPELLKFVQTMGQELPLHTRVLIFTSNAVVEFWYVFVSVPVFIYSFILIAIKRSPAFHIAFDAAVLRIPLFGQIIKKLILPRIASYFALMYAAGITVLECLKTAEEIAGNKAIEEAHYEIAEITANVYPFDGNYRAALDQINRFGEVLRSKYQAHSVTAVNLPLDTRSSAQIRGDTKDMNIPEKAAFALRVVFGAEDANG